MPQPLRPASPTDRVFIASRFTSDHANHWLGPPSQLALPDEELSPGVYRTTFAIGPPSDPDGFLRLEASDGLGAIVVWVRPSARRQGLAASAVQYLAEHANELRLLVLEALVEPANHVALAFFGSQGFSVASSGPPLVLHRCVGQLAP